LFTGLRGFSGTASAIVKEEEGNDKDKVVSSDSDDEDVGAPKTHNVTMSEGCIKQLKKLTEKDQDRFLR
jgi:hypothetical protein